MRSEEYRRLQQVCLDMAQQSKSRRTRARWLTVAEAALDLSRDADDWNSSTTERDVLSILALGGSVP